jgi:hypothetical protein
MSQSAAKKIGRRARDANVATPAHAARALHTRCHGAAERDDGLFSEEVFGLVCASERTHASLSSAMLHA